jgi:arylsulfatase A-like enzyme
MDHEAAAGEERRPDHEEGGADPAAAEGGGHRHGVSRRRFLVGAAAAGVAGAAASACGIGIANAVQNEKPSAAARAKPNPTVKATGGNGMNVAVLVIDSLRTDHVGAYGGTAAQTPNLDAFAGTATRFSSAIPEAMPTILVRRAIHTGMRTYPARNWKPLKQLVPLPGWDPIPDKETTLAELLQQVGYTNVLLADNPMVFGPSMNFQRGYQSYEWTRGQAFDVYRSAKLISDSTLERYLTPSQRTSSDANTVRQYLANLLGAKTADDWPAARLYSRAVSMLDDLKELQPFCLVVDTFEVHEPWLPPPGYVERYQEHYDGIEPIEPAYGSADYLTEAQLARMGALYAGEATFIDDQVGRFMEALASKGLADNTMVVVVTDHGILLGDHGLTGKPAYGLYPELTDIMLMIRQPDVAPGTVSGIRAGTHDITPTVLAATGIKIDGKMDGTDVLGVASAAAKRTHQTSMYADTLWVSQGDWMLIAPRYGAEAHLFDLKSDPGCTNDLAATNGTVVRSLLAKAKQDANGPIPHYKLT